MVQKGCWSSSLFDCFCSLYLVLQVGSLALFIMITQGSMLLRAATILKVSVPWAEGKRALEVFPGD